MPKIEPVDHEWADLLSRALPDLDLVFVPVGGTVEVSEAGAAVATLALTRDRDRLIAQVSSGGAQVCTSARARLLLAALHGSSHLAGCTQTEVVSAHLLVRYHARKAGFYGGLRRPLVRDAPGEAPASPLVLDPAESLGVQGGGEPGYSSADERQERHARRHRSVAIAVAGLVPGARLKPEPPPGPWRQLIGRSTTGFAARLSFRVSADGLPLRFRFSFPDTPDLMVEPVAAVLDTTIAIAGASGTLLRGLREISMRHDIGMRQGRVRGLTEASAAHITMNGSYASASSYEGLLSNRRRTPPKRPSTTAPPPLLDIDHVIAHELWHLLESGWMATDYRASMEFRRRLGEYYGVDTLERIAQPDLDGAGPPFELPYRQLMQDASPYATTNVREATAELFAKWWCHPSPQPAALAYVGEQLSDLLGIRRP